MSSKDETTTPPHRSGRSVAWAGGILAFAAIGVAAFLLYFAIFLDPTLTESDPVQVGYVDEQACSTCHQPEYAAWTGSHHDLAMQVATNDSVLGNFADATFVGTGTTSRFFRRNAGFFVNTEGPDGTPEDFEISYTFGVEPLQQYLIEFPGGRLQTLSIAWDTEQEQWFHLYPDREIAPDDPFHWTGPYQNWNLMCAECHSTNLEKNYDADTLAYQTSWDVIDVACQSCHGPGEEHVRLARAEEEQEFGDTPGLGLLVSFAPDQGSNQVETCAPCHSRRSSVSVDDRTGEPFLDHFMPALLLEDLYHADGQILDEVYVYGSFLQSRMSDQGVVCTDCHNPHSLELRADGNALCIQCHNPQTSPERFPALAALDYDSAEHHRHSVNGEGGQCVNCHMPERTYMVVDPRRDHSFRIPRPDLSVTLGTPNACNGCHTDQSTTWAADAVAGWYGVDGGAAPHYGEIIAAGRSGSPDSVVPLTELANDLAQPDIVRATAVRLLGDFGEAGVQGIVDHVNDPGPLVRATAVGNLDSLQPEAKLRILTPLLNDSVRAVRTEAARVLLTVAGGLTAAEDRAAFDQAFADYQLTQMTLTDTPAGQMNLGIVHSASGRIGQAVDHYRSAITIDPDFAPAYMNLATLLNQSGQNAEAEEVLRTATARVPDDGDAHYSLGLLLAEMTQLEEATISLGRAAALVPNRARIRYNYGLALQRLERRPEAETELLAAATIEPENPTFLTALTILYVQEARWSEALPWAESLAGLLPLDVGANRTLEQIRAQIQDGLN